MVFDSTKTEDMDTHGEDHAVDALRYALINLAAPSIRGWLSDAPEQEPSNDLPATTLRDVVVEDSRRTFQEALEGGDWFEGDPTW
jgi:hypothetical protein